MRFLLSLLVLSGVLFGNAFAWNRPTHMGAAAAAYAELGRIDPAARNEIVRILKTHPDYRAKWEPEVRSLAPEEQGLYLFMLASRWPDDIRHLSAFAHEKWHYINFPFKPSDQPASLAVTGPEEENIIEGYRKNLDVLRSPTPDSAKAVALAWVLHTIGDVHQPLHTVKKVTTDLPNGDRGGNDFYVQQRAGLTVITLHKVWDDAVTMDDREDNIIRFSRRLLSSHPRADLPELRDTSFANWAEKESLPAAVEYAYRHGRLKGSRDHHDHVPLPADYMASIRPIAERRVALAAYRMADVLARVF